MSADCITAPCRPALRWFGGKWRVAPWIISRFPPHRTYVEPFGGAASVLIRKPRAYAEVYNDLDEWVVNFFRVLRDPDTAADLVRRVELTPFSRVEFDECRDIEASSDPIERARMLAVRSFQGFGANAHNGRSTGFRANSNRSGTTPAGDWRGYPAGLRLIIERFQGVTIESRPALQVMNYHDGADTLHYVDPPYLQRTRSEKRNGRGYRHELEDGLHGALLASLRELRGMVILSGYPDPQYDAGLPGWRREELQSYADGAKKRTECIWINPQCVEALAMPKQLEMVEEER